MKPWANGMDVTRRPRSVWIIDFGSDMPESEAALYEAPFEYIKEHVKPAREKSRSTRKEWWLHERPRPDMRAAIKGLPRYIATPTVAKHRLFVFLDAAVLPDHQLIVFARADWFTFGVLHSRPHELWALRMGTSLEDRPRYTPTSTFETFPFQAPSDAHREAVEEAARALHEARESALQGDPKLTLTALYNKRPTWLEQRHAALDAAVVRAYGWPEKLGEEEILERLLTLNLQRAAEERRALKKET